jgi:hypothetical protein
MLNEILNIANKYADGLKEVQDRRAKWLLKHKKLKTHLKEIADDLNANTTYKQGFYVDTLHAFNEEINGTCAELPSITFRSGDMSMLVSFRNSLGEKKEFTEHGFHITFNPTITGQIVILLFPHDSDLNKTPPPYLTLAVVDDPEQLTMEVADDALARGIEAAFTTSFTGMVSHEKIKQDDSTPPQAHNPIGFKRYETTEKVE